MSISKDFIVGRILFDAKWHGNASKVIRHTLNCSLGHWNTITNAAHAINERLVNQKAFKRMIRNETVRSIKQFSFVVVKTRCKNCSIVGMDDLYRRMKINETKTQIHFISKTCSWTSWTLCRFSSTMERRGFDSN